jgi:Arc/MetJ-type ribon-helix-helix transcriptional regulator
MAKITVLIPDELYDEVIGAVELADQEENVSRFVRAAIRAELTRRKKGKKA